MVSADDDNSGRRHREALFVLFAVEADDGAFWHFVPLVDDAALQFAVLTDAGAAHDDALVEFGAFVNVDEIAEDRTVHDATADDHARGQ